MRIFVDYKCNGLWKCSKRSINDDANIGSQVENECNVMYCVCMLSQKKLLGSVFSSLQKSTMKKE